MIPLYYLFLEPDIVWDRIGTFEGLLEMYNTFHLRLLTVPVSMNPAWSITPVWHPGENSGSIHLNIHLYHCHQMCLEKFDGKVALGSVSVHTDHHHAWQCTLCSPCLLHAAIKLAVTL